MSVLNSSIEPGKSTKPKRDSTFTALQYRDFRLLWLGQMVWVTGSQMHLVAVDWHVWILSKSALAWGMVCLFRAVPIILCSLLVGFFADVVDRKRLMIVTQSSLMASAAC